MGVDLLRGGGGRSHFLIASLALLSLFLLFNWWSLSTDNLDLLKQIEGLTQHLKSGSSLLDECRSERGTLKSKVERLEEDAEQMNQKLDSEQKKSSSLEKSLKDSNNDVVSTKKQLDTANFTLKNCQTELDSSKKVDKSKDSMITAMRYEKTDLIKQIDDLKAQISSLSSQLTQLKLAQASQKKATSSTAVQRAENDVENEVRNIAEPYHADEKESQHKGDHVADKDDQIDERELEMQGNADDRKV